MLTKRIKCSCEHGYQDNKYGKKVRVYNNCAGKDNKYNEWKCTVCGDKEE